MRPHTCVPILSPHVTPFWYTKRETFIHQLGNESQWLFLRHYSGENSHYYEAMSHIMGKWVMMTVTSPLMGREQSSLWGNESYYGKMTYIIGKWVTLLGNDSNYGEMSHNDGSFSINGERTLVIIRKWVTLWGNEYIGKWNILRGNESYYWKMSHIIGKWVIILRYES